MTIGVREGRSGNAEFNLRAYVLHNRDLLDYYKTDLSAYCKHYMEIGKAEGRTCLPTGDEQGLIGTYSTHYDTTVLRAVKIGIEVELSTVKRNGYTAGTAFFLQSDAVTENTGKWIRYGACDRPL